MTPELRNVLRTFYLHLLTNNYETRSLLVKALEKALDLELDSLGNADLNDLYEKLVTELGFDPGEEPT